MSDKPNALAQSLAIKGYSEVHHDFMCPYCGSKYALEWTTEYGDPIDGDYLVECDNTGGCQRSFVVSVETNTTYSARKR